MQGVKLGRPIVDCGPFAMARKNVDNFCHNLFLSSAISKCTEQLQKAEKEYTEAKAQCNESLMEQKKTEIQVFQSSLQLTAYMFDALDGVTT
jgi:hypothetical protein